MSVLARELGICAQDLMDARRLRSQAPALRPREESPSNVFRSRLLPPNWSRRSSAYDPGSLFSLTG